MCREPSSATWRFLLLLAICSLITCTNTSITPSSLSEAQLTATESTNNGETAALLRELDSSPTSGPSTPANSLISASERAALLEILRCWPMLSALSSRAWDAHDMDNACIRNFYGLTCYLNDSGQFLITGVTVNARWRPPIDVVTSVDGLINLDTLKIDSASMDSSNLAKFLVPSLTQVSLLGLSSDLLPQSFLRLAKLESLEIRDSHFVSNIPSFNHSSQLAYLNISNNPILQTWDPVSNAAFTKLQTLIVTNNAALTSLPLFSNTSSLTSVNIQYTSITSLWSAFTNCTSIKELIIRNNPALNFLPRYLLQASGFTSFDIRFNNLSLPGSLDGISGLKLSQISLEGNSMKTVPTGFCQLNRPLLSSISLFNNNLTVIPSCIGNYYNLRSLNLSSAGPATSIPSAIQNLVLVENLDFSRLTALTSLPTTLANMRSLKNLSLVDANLTMPFPTQWFEALNTFGELALQNLFLAGNNFYGTLPDSLFAEVPQLATLDISGSNLSGPFPSLDTSVTGLALTSILASGNSFDLIPESISQLSQLETLDFSYNNLSVLPSDDLWYELPSLKEFLVAGNPFLVGQSLPTWWTNSTSISVVDLSLCGFTGTLPTLSTPNLQVLSIARNQLTGSINLASIPTTLSYLNLSHNSLIKAYVLPQMGVQRTYNLTSLDISYNRLTGSIPNLAFAKSTLNLLYLQGNRLTGSLPYLGSCQKLGHLDLDNNALDLCGANPGVSTIAYLAPITCRLTSYANDSVCECAEWYSRCRIGTVCTSSAPSFNYGLSLTLASLCLILVLCIL